MTIQFRLESSTQMPLLALDWEFAVGSVEWDLQNSSGRLKSALG